MTTADKAVVDDAATKVETEYADVVIVGTRISGTAAAVVFARAGLRVIGLDKSRFPSDTMSTHIMVPNAVQELARMGALEKVLALNPARSKYLSFDVGDVRIRERLRPYGGIDYGLTVPRDQLDGLLVEAARDAGAGMRERCLVEGVMWEDGRVAGVRYRTSTGRHEIRAKLVIGADGRKSKIAAEVGAWEPYRGSKNGRGFAFRYIDDPIGAEQQDTYEIFRSQGNQTLVIPSTPAGRAIVVHMCYASDVPRFREDPEGIWQEKLDRDPKLRKRLEGTTDMSPIRTTDDLSAFYRKSSGPGWMLIGDAGHFKDPVTGNGMRDALKHGRLAAEYVAPVIQTQDLLDRAVTDWEKQRDRDTLPTYHWGNRETRPVPTSRLAESVLATFSGSEEPGISDLFNRAKYPEDILSPSRMIRGLAGALFERGADRRAILAEVAQELSYEVEVRRSRFLDGFRSKRGAATEHPGWSVGKAP